MKLYCSKCKEPVSSNVPDGTYISGSIICRKCTGKSDNRELFHHLRDLLDAYGIEPITIQNWKEDSDSLCLVWNKGSDYPTSELLTKAIEPLELTVVHGPYSRADEGMATAIIRRKR